MIRKNVESDKLNIFSYFFRGRLCIFCSYSCRSLTSKASPLVINAWNFQVCLSVVDRQSTCSFSVYNSYHCAHPKHACILWTPNSFIQIVVVDPDTGGTRCMVECPQCLGLQLFCSLLPSGSIAPPPLTPAPLSWLDISLSKFGCQATDYNY